MRVLPILVLVAVVLAGCGSGTVERTGTTAPQAERAAPALTPAQRRMRALVRRWSRLMSVQDAAIADVYRLPATVVQGPNTYTLATPEDVRRFHAGLPCAGRIVKITYAGATATATFRLRQRPTGTCQGVGALVAARFEFAGGRISGWIQIPVPEDAGGGPVA